MESQGRENAQSQPSIDIQESNNVIETTLNENENNMNDSIGIEDVSQEGGKRKRTSKAWNHFKVVKIGNIQYAECNYCKKRLKAPSDYGTTHLMKHYERACKQQPRKMDIRQSFLVGNNKLSGGEELTSHVFRQEESRRELAIMVILHDYPLLMVEHIDFRRFVASLQPCFNMVSRNTMKSDIMRIYGDEKVKYFQLLDKLKRRVAITTDMWTSSNNKKGFMAVIAHFFDDSWTLRSFILRFVYVPAPHTAEVLAQVLSETLMDWNIDWKLLTITIDNCTTNDAMFHHLLDKLPSKDLPLDEKVLYMGCCAHILNLIVKDGLEIIGGAIEKIRDSVMYWTTSPARVENFEEAARHLNIPCAKRLSLDCKTHWNSTYLMLESAIIYKDVFPRLKVRERNYKSLSTDND
ncbi:UNVERIFIED_CONTAM: Zinc finger BED domain-containing protein RICESLEEPER 2 [Sesamum radiatum]|uniref:Zinc finger BED domain-containing protein RICESLEEPER 2 n=1 Tax=Sesamum radiatum TaxID=300843 RepID=A0AAW2UAC7_SESRA